MIASIPQLQSALNCGPPQLNSVEYFLRRYVETGKTSSLCVHFRHGITVSEKHVPVYALVSDVSSCNACSVNWYQCLMWSHQLLGRKLWNECEEYQDKSHKPAPLCTVRYQKPRLQPMALSHSSPPLW